VTDDNPSSGVPLRAFAHPLRLQLLSLLTGTAMSAAEVARELGTTQANASYHLRRLEAAGLLRVVEEVEVRGGRAKRYQHDTSSAHGMSDTSLDDFQVLAAAMGEELRRRIAHRRLRSPGPLTDAELWVDPQVWQDVCDRVAQAMVDLHDAARPPRSEGTVRTSTTLSMFVMEDGESSR
jgi:DNA-binding transcriptional ArsR family regulator